VGVKNFAAIKKKARQVRSHVKVMLTVFLIVWVLFTTSFYHKAGHSIRSIIWKLCNVCVRQSEKKDLMPDGRIDGCSNMTTRPHIHRSLSVTSWPNTTTFLPQPPYSPDLAPADFFLFPKLKSTLKGRRFESVDAIKTFAGAFAQHS
jgi:hypothetical protein